MRNKILPPHTPQKSRQVEETRARKQGKRRILIETLHLSMQKIGGQPLKNNVLEASTGRRRARGMRSLVTNSCKALPTKLFYKE